MAILGDISVAVNGDIRWVGDDGGGPYTVLELHRYLQDLADNADASGNDLLDITSDTPSARSTDNIIELLGDYNIDATLAQHLYDGSISQDGGDEMYSGLVVVGSVASTTTLMIIQNNALYDDGVHTPATPFWGTNLNEDSANNILMRCMIKTKTGGSDIDGKRLRIQARELGDTYAEFSVTMGLGNATAAIFTNTDLNNQTVEGTISGWGITNDIEGFNGIDLDNGNGEQLYYSKWQRNAFTINQLYERAKWLQRRGNTTVDMYGIDGELFRGITHEVPLTATGSGTFDAFEGVSWTGGTGQMLAIDDVDGASATKMWIQLLTGTQPSTGVTITGVSTATAITTGVAVTARSLAPCFIGQSTGSSIIGAYGIGVRSDGVTNTDKLFDLNNVLQQPPNNVTFTVSGLVTDVDSVLVGPEHDVDGGIKFDQLTLAIDLDGATETSVVCTTSIPADTPSSGTIRVQLDDGRYRRVPYTEWSGSTFTIASSDWTSPNIATDTSGARNIFISYIDDVVTGTSMSFTSKYTSDRDLFVRVREGTTENPIKTFETPATLGSGGGAVAAIRTSDK